MLRALPIENTNIKIQKYGKKTIMFSGIFTPRAKNVEDYENFYFIHVLLHVHSFG